MYKTHRVPEVQCPLYEVVDLIDGGEVHQVLHTRGVVPSSHCVGGEVRRCVHVYNCHCVPAYKLNEVRLVIHVSESRVWVLCVCSM